MHVEMTPGHLVVRLGPDFTVRNAERLREAVRAWAPVAHVTVDLSRAAGLGDAVLVELATALREAPGVQVALRGVTHHQARILSYCLDRPASA